MSSRRLCAPGSRRRISRARRPFRSSASSLRQRSGRRPSRGLPGSPRSRSSLAGAGWVWGAFRLDTLDRSFLVTRIGHVDRTVAEVTAPPRHGQFELRVMVEGPGLRRLPHRRACPPGASARPSASAGCRDRDGGGGQAAASTRRRLRRTGLARAPGDPRRAARTPVAPDWPARRDRRRRRSSASLRRARDRARAGRRARGVDRRSRPRCRRGVVARSADQVPPVGAVPPAGRLWTKRRDHRGGDPAAGRPGGRAPLAG